jgi:hypothetical protein
VTAAKHDWRFFKYGWPFITFAVISALTYLPPVHTQLPAPEFYRVAAEVIPLLLLATMFEGKLTSILSTGLVRAEFVVVLALAEVAAFLAVSGLFTPDDNANSRLVGGTTVGTNLLACMIGTGLIGAALLVGWVILRPAD